MRVKVIASSLIVGVGGCAWLQEQMRPVPQTAPGWATTEVDQVAFDGKELSFRLTIGAADGGVVLDRRLVENADVELTEARDCDAGADLPVIFADFFPTPPGPSDLLELRPGKWYGARERFLLFIPDEDGGSPPSCVDATFVFRPEVALNPQVTFHVKADLVTPTPPPDADAGVP